MSSNPFDEHTRMWAREIAPPKRWPWQARLGARLSDFIDRHSDHDRRADAPLWWRAARSCSWLALHLGTAMSHSEHQWQDTGFADVEECAVPGCRALRSGGLMTRNEDGLKIDLARETCACGYRTPLADLDSAHRTMQLHRLGCTAVTSRG